MPVKELNDLIAILKYTDGTMHRFDVKEFIPLIRLPRRVPISALTFQDAVGLLGFPNPIFEVDEFEFQYWESQFDIAVYKQKPNRS